MQSSTCKKPRISVIRSGYMNENGAVLVLSLVFMVLLAMVGSTAVVLTTTDMKIGSNYKDSEAAFNDAQAGVQYAIGKMEEGLKAWPRTFTLPTSSTAAIPLISTFTVPTGFGFTYPSPELTWIQDDPDIYEFSSNGTGIQGGNAGITVRVQRLPAIMFGVFGDELLDLGNMAGVYSYAHDDCIATGCYPLDPGDSTNEGDIGSNNSVILRNNASVDGDVAVGENTGGTDGTVTDLGGVVTGEKGADIPRVDPDPLGILGGETAADFATYSTCPAAPSGIPTPGDPGNDNCNPALIIEDDIGNADNTYDPTGPSIHVKFAGDSLTLRGKPGGANFYFTEIKVDANTALYIDTTFGPVNIYLTGPLTAGNGAEVVNTKDGTCSDGFDSADPPVAVADDYCSCCTYTPPNIDCTPCTTPQTKIGAPGDFVIYANSTNDPSEKITLGNSSIFSGIIFAPGIEVVMNNSADIHGAIMAKRVDIVNNVKVYFDTNIKDQMKSNDLKIVSWRDNRL